MFCKKSGYLFVNLFGGWFLVTRATSTRVRKMRILQIGRYRNNHQSFIPNLIVFKFFHFIELVYIVLRSIFYKLEKVFNTILSCQTIIY